MEYLYGRDWHPFMRTPIAPLSESKAKVKFSSGPRLSVSAGPNLKAGRVPEFTLNIAAQGVAVEVQRYNAAGSISTIYTFEQLPEHGNRMFLHDVKVYLYPDDDECYSLMDARAVSVVNFRPERWARHREQVSGIAYAHVSEYTDVDVSRHWEAPIAFGDWDRFGVARELQLPAD